MCFLWLVFFCTKTEADFVLTGIYESEKNRILTLLELTLSLSLYLLTVKTNSPCQNTTSITIIKISNKKKARLKARSA